jgi:hypothetical protein
MNALNTDAHRPLLTKAAAPHGAKLVSRKEGATKNDKVVMEHPTSFPVFLAHDCRLIALLTLQPIMEAPQSGVDKPVGRPKAFRRG